MKNEILAPKDWGLITDPPKLLRCLEPITVGSQKARWQKIEVVPGFEPGLPERFDFDVIKIRSDNHYTIQPLMEDLGNLRDLCSVRVTRPRENVASPGVWWWWLMERGSFLEASGQWTLAQRR